MKLTKVRVSDFQSVRDSTEFDIGDVTCLVGKNEAGKTALLQAMYRLRPIVDTDVGYNVTDDYPRRDVADYEHDIEEEKRKHAVVAHLTYELDETDAAAIAKVFGPKALTSRTLTISKAYEQQNITFSLSVNHAAGLQHILSRYSVPDETREALKSCSTPAEATKVVANLEQTEAIQSITKWLNAFVTVGSIDLYIYNEILGARVPKFMYFDEYYQMRGCDNIDTLKQRVAAGTLEKSDHPMLGLIRIYFRCAEDHRGAGHHSDRGDHRVGWAQMGAAPPIHGHAEHRDQERGERDAGPDRPAETKRDREQDAEPRHVLRPPARLSPKRVRGKPGGVDLMGRRVRLVVIADIEVTVAQDARRDDQVMGFVAGNRQATGHRPPRRQPRAHRERQEASYRSYADDSYGSSPDSQNGLV